MKHKRAPLTKEAADRLFQQCQQSDRKGKDLIAFLAENGAGPGWFSHQKSLRKTAVKKTPVYEKIHVPHLEAPGKLTEQVFMFAGNPRQIAQVFAELGGRA